MDWEDLRFLLGLGRAGRLLTAARQLGVSHTTVARRLARLERTLGIRLVEKTPEGLRLTDAARRVVQRIEDMESSALSIERSLAGEDTRLEGCVRVTSTEALGSHLLARPLAEFAACHPALTVELVTEAQTLSLARREADIAVRLLRPLERTAVGVRMGKVAFAPYATRESLAATSSGPRLLTWREPIAGAETQWLLRRYPRSHVVLRTNSTQSLLESAVAGAGIALLPCFLGDAEPTLERLAGPREAPPCELWLVTHRDLRRVARVSALFSLLKDILRRHAPLLAGEVAPHTRETGVPQRRGAQRRPRR